MLEIHGKLMCFHFNFDDCLMHSPLFVYLAHQNLSARAFFLSQFIRKSKCTVINL